MIANPDRLLVLQQSGMLDTPPEERFDRLTRLARQLLHAPIALITLIDAERQFFKSCIGFPEPWASLRETPLSHSFCRLIVESGAPLVVHNALADPTLRDIGAVTELGLVAYLGAPILGPGEQVLGALCVLDAEPRDWTEQDTALLRDLAASATTEIELENRTRQLTGALEREQEAHAAVQRLAEVSLSTVRTLSLEERLRIITERAREIIGAHQAVTSLTHEFSSGQLLAAVSLSEKYRDWKSFDAPAQGKGIVTAVCDTNQTLRLTQEQVEAHPAWRGFGEYAHQHPPMRGWLAAPLLGHDGRNIGLIQLSDKYHGEFTEADEAILVQLAQLASAAVVNARLYTEARAGEERLRRQNAALVALAGSEAFVSGSFAAALRQATETAADTLEVERASIWLLEDEPLSIGCLDLFERTPRSHSHGFTLSGDQYPSYFASLLTEEILPIEAAQVDPRTSEFTESYLAPLDIRSMLDAPIRVRGRLIGVVCHEQVGVCRSWTQDEQNFARSLADLVATAFEISERVRAEEALRRSEAMTSAIIQSSPDAIITVDRTGAIVEFSPAAERIFGYRKSDVAGRPLSEYLIPETLRAAHREAFDRARMGGDTMRIHRRLELPATGADGSEFPVELTVTTIHVSGSMLFAAFARDITERQEAERAVREAEQRFREVVENLPLVFWVYDKPQDAFTYVSPAWDRITGTSPLAGEAHPRSMLERVHPDDRARLIAAWRRLIAGGSFRHDYRLVRPDGEIRWLRTRASAIRSATGETIRVVGTTEDVTARQQVEDALQLSNRIVDVVNSGIVISDLTKPERPIVYVNPAFERITGYSPEEVLGRNLDLLRGPETAVETAAQVRAAVTEGTPITVELIYHRKDGSSFWSHLSVTPIRNPEGRITQKVAILEDVTEQKTLAEQFRQSQKMEAVGQLAGGVAHDFNNMLAVVNGYAELLLMSLPTQSPMRGHIQEIKAAGERAANITRQLLALSRKQLLAPKVLSVNGAVSEMHKMLRRLIGEDIELVTVLDPACGHVKADPSQLQQVLLNLCVNARDAMPQGGRLALKTERVVVSAGSPDQDPDLLPGNYAVISVSDTGTGMSKAILGRIFEPFFTTKDPGKGTGLGLATVFGIVKQSGGQISVESWEGSGSTFRVYFPEVETPGGISAPDSSAALASGAGVVLLCEDEAIVRNMVETILRQCGYTVLTATDPHEALRIAEEQGERIDLLLTDVVMPGMSGTHLAELLRSRLPELKILFMSGYTDDAVIRHGLGHATVDLLQKPFSASALAARVRELLRSSSGRRRCLGRLLVVDDDPAARETLTEVLEEEGYQVATAGDGLEALHHLQSGHQTDLILLDLSMPRMNGWVFRTEQRKDPELARIPVLLLSGATDVNAAADFLGVVGSLVKPLDVEQLLGLIARHCPLPSGKR